MRAIILGAGLGSRLLPLTSDRPKCLVRAGGRTILEHQLDALKRAGVTDVTLVGGYRFDRLKAFVAGLGPRLPRIELVYNPFYAVANSIGSVWAARHRMTEAFCLLNGDTIFAPELVGDGLSRVKPGINLFVEQIHAAGPDDMLARVEKGDVVAVSKALPMRRATHRSLGFIACTDRAAAATYRAALDEVIGGPGGDAMFHHAIVDQLARQGAVRSVGFDEDVWVEIDRPEDIDSWLQVARDSAAA